MSYVLNKYPNISENYFYLTIIILIVVLFVTVIQIIICVESACFYSTNEIVDTQILFAQTLHNSLFDTSMRFVDAKD